MSPAGRGNLEADIAEALMLMENMCLGESDKPPSLTDFFRHNPIMERIPNFVIQDCNLIGFVYSYTGAFVVGAESASGLLMMKLPEGNWSAPIAITGAGMTMGFTFGAGKSSIVYIGTKTFDPTKLTKAKIDVGFSMVAAVGPVGEKDYIRLTEVSLEQRPPLLSYATGKGLVAGVSSKLSRVSINHAAMKEFYGHDINVEAMIDGTSEMDIYEKKSELKKLKEVINELAK